MVVVGTHRPSTREESKSPTHSTLTLRYKGVGADLCKERALDSDELLS